MKAILNHEIHAWEDIRLFPDNRGFRYGDGFFETIAIVKGNPRFLELHIDRLKKGALLLKLATSEILDLAEIEKDIRALQLENNIIGNAKVRFTLWRDSAGLYTPADGRTSMLMTIEKMTIDEISIINNAHFSDTVTNNPSPFSRFKTLSAMKYVLAGIEKKDKHLDEIILLDYRGYISESLNSNLFWKKNYTYFTPPLSTGCIEGIMRNWLIDELKTEGYTVEEKLAGIDEFLEADCIFATNALGIRHVKNIAERLFSIDAVARDMVNAIS